ncbi:MAG: HlyD family efflux transporter periplasmic adaptor subunit [Usitatibacter sp.]
MALFRAESQQAREGAWLGKIVLARPLSFSLLTAVAVGIVIALAAFFTFTEYTRKARVTGALAPAEGVVRVLAQQAGRVESLSVREGDTVQRGETLLGLADARAGASREDIGAAMVRGVRDRQRALEQQREFVFAAMRSEQAAFAQRHAGIEREIASVDRELESQARRRALAAEASGRADHLASIGFLSAAARDRERDASLDQEARHEAMKRSRLAFSREVASIEFDAAAALARSQAQVAGIDLQRAALEQERIERGVQYHAAIVAPVSGLVSSLLVEPGQMVLAGTTLATIIPEDARLEAHLYSPSRSIGFVRPGQEVLVRYLAYPHQKFGSHGARITMVSRNALAPAELGFASGDGGREPLYRIKATLASQSVSAYGRAEPLQAGMQLEADVLLDRRRLIEWLFEPLLSLAGRA